MGTETPLLFIRRITISKKEIARLRIIFLIEVHRDGDAPEVIRKTTNSKREISRLRINFLIEMAPPSLYTQNADSRTNEKHSYLMSLERFSDLYANRRCYLSFYSTMISRFLSSFTSIFCALSSRLATVFLEMSKMEAM